MKTQLLIGAVAFAVSQLALAAGGGGGGGHHSGGIEITGTSSQETSAGASLVYNHSVGDRTEATQSLSSNVSNITIGGKSTQSTNLLGASVANVSVGGDAVQNLSSNADKVDIDGKSTQTTNIIGSDAQNIATGYGSYATQNMSSNFGNIEISAGGKSTQTTSLLLGSTAKNESIGALSFAAQNMSTNFGKVTISGDSTQKTKAVYSDIINLASGGGSAARQSLSTNTSCQVDQTCTGLRYRGH